MSIERVCGRFYIGYKNLNASIIIFNLSVNTTRVDNSHSKRNNSNLADYDHYYCKFVSYYNSKR